LRELQNCWWGGNVGKRDEGKWVAYLSTEIGSGKGKKLFSTMRQVDDKPSMCPPLTVLLLLHGPLTILSWYSYSS